MPAPLSREVLTPLLPLLHFIRTDGSPRRAGVPFETFKNNLAHGLALQGRFCLDFAPQFYVDVLKM